MSLRPLLSIALAGALLVLSLGTVMAQPSQGEGSQECELFPETGFELCAPFLAYWNDNGGLPVFGYPITDAADEVNPDLDQELLTQYFERERMESHPTFAPPYDILLGRLGVEVLEMMGRDWWQYPKADPSTLHYQAVTGQAIAPEFYDYYTSHGLDFGDEGVSFAESLALFGYPVSPAMMETNSSGDTVLTQWYERARFEYHPNNDPENQVQLGLLGNEILADESMYAPIAEGLNNPRGLSTDDFAIVIAEAGFGGDDCIQSEGPEGEAELCFGDSGSISIVANDGSFQDRIVTGLQSYSIDGFEVIGPQAAVGDGADGGFILMGLGSSPEGREAWGERADMLGWLLHVDGEGNIEGVLDIAAWEAEDNPDGGAIDSNPFGLVMTDDGGFIVSDAGANALFKITPELEISTLAVFPDQIVPTEGLPIPDLPPEIPMQSVPTGVTIGPDGNYYVGELTGFPFLPGYARVWQVTPDGDASVYADGFTNILGVSFDLEGNLYVVEITENGLLYADPADPASLVGAVWKVDTDDERVKLSDDGVVISTGIVVGNDNSIYVSNFGLMPGMGQVIKFPAEGAPPSYPAIADGLNNPRGLSYDDEGPVVIIAEAGFGGDDCIQGEGPEGPTELCFGTSGAISIANDDFQDQILTGLQSYITGDGEVIGPQAAVGDGGDGGYITMGLGSSPEGREAWGERADMLGWLLHVDGDNNIEPFADIAAYEAANNPDGGEVDSNPFGLARTDDGDLIVSDAGGNDLLKVTPEGEISTLAVFPDRLVPTDGIPIPDLPPEIPMQSVPTGVTIGPDGAYYVGELTGFPFVPGMAQVWRVTDDGEMSVYADGFTNILGVSFDSAGNLYVAEMFENGLLSGDPTGAVWMVTPDGERTKLTDGSVLAVTGIVVGDDMVYANNFGIMPGMGQVIMFPPPPMPEVFILTPTDDATVSSPVTVEMGAVNFTIEVAGTARPGAGHFHLMIDVPCVNPGETIPGDDNHKHYGAAQTMAELELEPGEHTLCLQAGNGVHTALDLTDEIMITVTE